MSNDPRDRDLSSDNSHVSGHGVNSNDDRHEISQEFDYDGDKFISYTDVDSGGNVGDSGFDDKK